MIKSGSREGKPELPGQADYMHKVMHVKPTGKYFARNKKALPDVAERALNVHLCQK
jgi:hypothetical protein